MQNVFLIGNIFLQYIVDITLHVTAKFHTIYNYLQHYNYQQILTLFTNVVNNYSLLLLQMIIVIN